MAKSAAALKKMVCFFVLCSLFPATVFGQARTGENLHLTMSRFEMLSNVEPVEKVYVCDVGQDDLAESLQAAVGANLVRRVGGIAETRGGASLPACLLDRWLQDAMEIGDIRIWRFIEWRFIDRHLPFLRFLFSPTPLPVALPMARGRSLDALPETLVDPDFGLMRKNFEVRSGAENVNEGGNLEVSPPIPHYPLGRIIVGTNTGDRLKRFLNGQGLQSPIIELNVSWLAVGHVDEIISFVPADESFKLIIASPQLATSLLQALEAEGHGDAILFESKEDADGRPFPSPSVSEFLNSPDFSKIREANVIAQEQIQLARSRLKTELNLADGDIIEFPAIYGCPFGNRACLPSPSAYKLAPLMPAMVNMLVVPFSDRTRRSEVFIPKPFGPLIDGMDPFEQFIQSSLGEYANIHFVDVWNDSHVLGGEIHCVTNAERRKR